MGANLQTVYVVLGNQGEYSDRNVWVFAVFTDGDEARSAVETVEARVREAINQGEEDREKRLKAIDPSLDDWYYDAIYYHVHLAPMVTNANPLLSRSS